MNVWHTRGMRWSLAVFTIAMAGQAVWAFSRFGATLLTAVAAVISIGCLAALLYVWRLSRRAVKTVERAVPGMTAEIKPPRRPS
ncbi:MAG: hypothetical protein A2151_01035 [Candidatus Muproteobacteria bacterium RBG_16_65_34]|uniref:Uncharacterized protein n=1 Tax=Candidatus Muproteobacteria bacterium RBG_16_65_34 TaxID=1817760 RepID=A0A1F6TL88_9PROT|nr:MAG: hypothetical protein A2151_01035 [Candidatus Muproteobacteria bacterium RBG_16_65_34]